MNQNINVKIWFNSYKRKPDGSVVKLMDAFPDFNHGYVNFWMFIDICKVG
jgi:hypothetical protein